MKKEWLPLKNKPGGLRWILIAACIALVLALVVGAALGLIKLVGRLGGTDQGYPWSQEEVEAVLGQDDGNWQKYSDLKQEKKAIASTLETFADSLNQGDVQGALNVICVEQQDAYRELFNSRPEALADFGKLVAKAKISFLSKNYDPDSTLFQRTAEYSVTVDGFTFYLIFIKVDGQWLLYDF